MNDQVISRIGRYDVVAHIASGGMGTVYRALDTSLNRTVALKILSPDLATKSNMLERFRREARSAAQLHHENIVAVYEFGEVNGTYFLAMEYVTGIDLHEYIASRPNNQLDVDEAKQILIQAARALDCAHRQGIVHRDVKPSNFLICGKGEVFLVKLTDFGLAREVNSDDFRLTRDNTTLGTVDYISPEQAQDSGAADIRSDMYSLGCTFYHMLAGHAPFPTGSLPERIMAHFQKEPADLRHINPAVPDRLWDVVRKLLAKNPADRFQTPLELLRELEPPDVFLAYMKQHPGMEQALSDGPSNRRRAYDPTVLLERSLEETPHSALDGLLPDEIGLAPSHGDVALPPAPPAPAATSPPAAGRSTEPKPAAAKAPPKAAPPAAPHKPIPARTAPAAPKKEVKSNTPEEIRAPHRDKADGKAIPKRGDHRSNHVVVADDEPRKVRRKRRRLPWPILAVGGAALVALVGIVVWFSTRPSAIEPKPPIDGPPDPPPFVLKDKDKEPENKPPKVIPPTPSVARVGPERPKLKPMAESALAFDRDKIRRDYVGAFPGALRTPENPKTVLVSRAPVSGKATLPTLEDAWKAIAGQAHAVIEIADQGPHYVTTLPLLERCRLLVRGAPGFRPLILWDVAAAASPNHLAEIAQGTLMLENLDFGVRWRNGKQTDPSAFFLLRDSSLEAWQCNLQQVEVHPQGLAVALIEGTDAATPVQVQFERCSLRGDDLQAVRIRNSAADVLIQGSLVANRSRPLLEWHGRSVGPNTVRFIRSTLVTRSHLIAWSNDADRSAMFPKLTGFAWDSILAHISGADGDLVHFDGTTSSDQFSWYVLNSAYLGWTRLLQSKDRQYATLEEWRSLRVNKEGDVFVKDSFAPMSPSALEAPDSVYQGCQEFLMVKASEGEGPIGVDFQALPPEPYPWAPRRLDWARHTYDGGDFPDIPFPDAGKPDIPAAPPDTYVGEVIDVGQLDLARFDLAQHLQSQLRASKHKPERIVVHVKGKGTVRSSPLRFEHLHAILFFDNLKLPNASLELLGLQLGTPEPLFEIVQGKLEIINARIRLAPAALSSAMTPVALRAVGSDLHLSNCRIDGPLDGVESFRALIQFQGQGAPNFHQLTLKECILTSGAANVELKGQGIGVRAKQNLFIATGDVFALAPGPFAGPRPDVFLFLDYNTFAWKQSLLNLVEASTADIPRFHHPILVQAIGNYHLSPFGGVAPLLRGSGELFQRDVLMWQGKNNVFDQTSLQTFDAPSPIAWPKLWGNASAQNAKWIDPKRGPILFSPETRNYQILALPKSVIQTPPPGANFKRLGLGP